MILIPDINLSIHDVTGGNIEHLPELLTLYQQLFPQYTRYLRIMERRANRPPKSDPRAIEHQWIGFIDNKPATVTIFKYLSRFNFGLGLDVGISPEYRSTKSGSNNKFLSEILTQLTMSQIAQDARRNHAPLPIGLVVEVESVKLVNRYQSYGFIELPIKYHEPPYINGQEHLLDQNELSQLQFQPMHLGIFKIRKRARIDDPEILSAITEGILCDHYHLAFDHWAVKQALDSIQH